MRAARKGTQRLLLDEVHDSDTGCLIDMVDLRRNPGIGCDAHRLVLMWITQRASRAFHPDKVASIPDFDPEGKGARRSASHRRNHFGLNGTERGIQC